MRSIHHPDYAGTAGVAVGNRRVQRRLARPRNDRARARRMRPPSGDAAGSHRLNRLSRHLRLGGAPRVRAGPGRVEPAGTRERPPGSTVSRSPVVSMNAPIVSTAAVAAASSSAPSSQPPGSADADPLLDEQVAARPRTAKAVQLRRVCTAPSRCDHSRGPIRSPRAWRSCSASPETWHAAHRHQTVLRLSAFAIGYLLPTSRQRIEEVIHALFRQGGNRK
jgi:hypothetical protein